MRVEVLSDHSQVLLDEVAVKHREASAHIAQGKTEEREAYAAERAARDRTPWWRRLSCVVSAEERREGLHARSVRVEIQAAQRRRIVLLGEEAKIKAGAAGEAALAVRLSKVLPDDWLMFQGYRGRRGEADLVVVGSLGIWVIEVKNLAVTLNAEGEDWRYVRARGGDAIEEPANDNPGRSWGRQAGDAARAVVCSRTASATSPCALRWYS
jgi:hypothetical protein